MSTNGEEKAERKPWHRRPGESSISHAKFLEYRNLGPSRSLDKLEARYGAARASGRIRAWSSRHDWPERAKQWDDHIEAFRDEVFLNDVIKWEKRRLQALESNWDVAQKWREKLAKMLSWPVQRQRVEDNGRVTIVEPARWSFQSAALITKMVAELEAATLTATKFEPEHLTDDENRAVLDASLGVNDTTELDAS